MHVLWDILHVIHSVIIIWHSLSKAKSVDASTSLWQTLGYGPPTHVMFVQMSYVSNFLQTQVLYSLIHWLWGPEINSVLSS